VSREKCLKVFKKLKVEEIDKIKSTLKDYVSSTPDSQYRKNPLTYLNQKSWNDEIIKKGNQLGQQKSFKQLDDERELAAIERDASAIREWKRQKGIPY
jgi:IS4 transposase